MTTYGYKKAETKNGNLVIIKMEILSEAISENKVFDRNYASFRSQKVKVVEIKDVLTGNAEKDARTGFYAKKTLTYTKGVELVDVGGQGVYFFFDEQRARSFPDNKIETTGDVRRYADNGQCILITEMKGGKEEGAHREFYEDGTRKVLGQWSSGIKVGDWYFFNNAWTEMEKITYNGEMEHHVLYVAVGSVNGEELVDRNFGFVDVKKEYSLVNGEIVGDYFERDSAVPEWIHFFNYLPFFDAPKHEKNYTTFYSNSIRLDIIERISINGVKKMDDEILFLFGDKVVATFPLTGGVPHGTVTMGRSIFPFTNGILNGKCVLHEDIISILGAKNDIARANSGWKSIISDYQKKMMDHHFLDFSYLNITYAEIRYENGRREGHALYHFGDYVLSCVYKNGAGNGNVTISKKNIILMTFRYRHGSISGYVLVKRDEHNKIECTFDHEGKKHGILCCKKEPIGFTYSDEITLNICAYNNGVKHGIEIIKTHHKGTEENFYCNGHLMHGIYKIEGSFYSFWYGKRRFHFPCCFQSFVKTVDPLWVGSVDSSYL